VQPLGAFHLVRRAFRPLQHKRTRGQRSVARIG
jgi:hypothetical protein